MVDETSRHSRSEAAAAAAAGDGVGCGSAEGVSDRRQTRITRRRRAAVRCRLITTSARSLQLSRISLLQSACMCVCVSHNLLSARALPVMSRARRTPLHACNVHGVSEKSRPLFYYDNFSKSVPIFIIFQCQKQTGSAEEVGIKTSASPQICCTTTLEKVSVQLCSTVNSVWSGEKTFSYSKCSRGIIFVRLSVF